MSTDTLQKSTLRVITVASPGEAMITAEFLRSISSSLSSVEQKHGLSFREKKVSGHDAQ